VPDKRLQRTRATLPEGEGYQFGDAIGPPALVPFEQGSCDGGAHWWSGPPFKLMCDCGERSRSTVTVPLPNAWRVATDEFSSTPVHDWPLQSLERDSAAWRPMHVNAAERLKASKLADGLLTVPFEPDLGGSVEDAEREALAAMPSTAVIVPLEIPLGCDRAVIRPSGVRVVEQYASVGTVDDPTPRTIGRVDLAYRLPARMPPHTQSLDDID
jgi:hypothetical protein